MLGTFFARYGKAFNGFDVDAILDADADCSIGAAPPGGACAKKDDRLRAALSQSCDIYKDLYERNQIAAVRVVERKERPITGFCSSSTAARGLFREHGSEVYRFDVTCIVPI
ncbi:MAG: hypothetical protein QMD46_08240 [Methanomicrobiales archaeon]|nr:hypothetical protein [Methanomicrobiales archaeon]